MSANTGADLFMSAEGFLDAIETHLKDDSRKPAGIIVQTKVGCPSQGCSWLYSTCICLDDL